MFILWGVNQWIFLQFYWLKLISLLQSFDSSKENKVFYLLALGRFDVSRNSKSDRVDECKGVRLRPRPFLAHLFFGGANLLGAVNNPDFNLESF